MLWGVAFLCNWERSQIGLAWTFGVYALPKPLTCFALEYLGVPLTCPAARLPSCIGAALSSVAPIQRRRPAPLRFVAAESAVLPHRCRRPLLRRCGEEEREWAWPKWEWPKWE